MLALALPVVAAEVGWVTMGIVDTIMVGPLGPEAIGAVGVGSSLYLGLAIFGIGVLLGLDTLVSQAFGAGRLEECHRWLFHGVALAFALAVPLTAVALAGTAGLGVLGFDPAVLRLAQPYLAIVSWSTLPLLLYAAFRRYLQAIGVAAPIMVALIAANVVNVVVNWVLIYGRFGIPALGVDGAAWATCASRVLIAGVLAAAIVGHDAKARTGLWQASRRIEMGRLRRLAGLGLPAALQVTLEVGVFAAATALAGRLAPVALAAHQIALQAAGLAFMVPLGISSAGAVRVGQAVGRGDAAGVSRAGWMALLMGAVFMSCSAAAFVLAPGAIVRLFTPDPEVVAIGTVLLLIAAVFQLFDGVQGVATGVLRGLGDTRTPMLWNLAGHWAFGLPLGYWLCFSRGWGVPGLWVGLSIGLIIVGLVLLAVWVRRLQELRSHAGDASAEVSTRAIRGLSSGLRAHNPGSVEVPTGE